MKLQLKNAAVFQLKGELTADQLRDAAGSMPHRLPASSELSQMGFIAPFGDCPIEEPQAGLRVLAVKESYRDLPSAVVNERVAERVRYIEQEDMRPVGRKERQTLKGEVLFELLPKCFIKHRITYVLITAGLLIIDTTSRKQAERICSLLREGLGGLKAVPIVDETGPTSAAMTRWVREGLHDPSGMLALGESAQLVGSRTPTKVNVRDLDLESAEVVAHLDSGLYVQKLALEFGSWLTFELDDSLHLRKIKFTDVVFESVEANVGESEDAGAYMAASAVLMGGILEALIAHLKNLFSPGEQEA